VILLVAHGSSDPRAAAVTRSLARAVGGVASFLDHAGPRPGEVLRGVSRAVVVPLLFTSAYHGRVDLPAAVDVPGVDVTITGVLGPVDGVVPPELLAALRRRLPAVPFDGLVLAAAGTRDAAARSTVDLVAAALGRSLGVPARAAYASAAAPDPATAVRELGGRVAVASYFLAPGRLYDAAAASARSAGAVAVAPPVGTAPELVRLVRRRIAEVSALPVAA